METNNLFSLNRFVHLLRRNYVLNFNVILITFIAVSGVLAIVGALSSIASPVYRVSVIVTLFYVVLFIVGFIFTSGIFPELHRPERSIHYLSLPASSFEKLFCGWLNTSVIYLGLSLVMFYFSYFVSSVLSNWWSGTPIEWFNIFNTGFLKICVIYLVTQPVFFFGAVYFKGFNFLKTLLALFVIAIAESLYQSMVGAVAFQDILMMAFQNRNFEGDMVVAPGLAEYMDNTFVPIIKAMFYYVIPVFFLVISYVRIKEREV